MESFTPQPQKDPRKLEDEKDRSGLKFFSMGIVVKTPGSFPSETIEVSPIETLTIQESGKVDRSDETYKQTHQDANGAFNSQKDVQKNNYIEATWLPLSDSNRDTAPCVYRDESVMLFKYADVQDKYYWTTIKHQPELRKKEMVRWSASNETKPLVKYTKETSFFVELNALEKKLEIGTPVNGEGIAYRIMMDIGKSQLDISDNEGNSVIIDSKKGVIGLIARNGLILDAKESLLINAKTTSINSENIQLNGEAIFSDGVKIAKDLKVGGSGGFGGDLGVGGTVSAKKVVGQLTNANVNTSDVSVTTARNQSANMTSGFTAGDKQAGSSYTPSAVANPSPQTDKSLKLDRVATVNASPKALTGDKIMDAVKMASGDIAKKFKVDLPDLSAIKEAASKVGNVGQQISSTAQASIGSVTGGIQSLVNTAQSVQNTVSGVVGGVVSTATGIVSQARATVMDPINSVTREIGSITSGITGQIQGVTSGVSNQVNGFLQPINELSRSFTGKNLSVMNQLNALTSKVGRATNSIQSINTLANTQISKLTTPINSLTNTANSVINKANYAAVNITEPLRQATRAIGTTQATAETAKHQLAALSSNVSKVSSNISDASSKVTNFFTTEKKP